jgi:hypothetical protein
VSDLGYVDIRPILARLADLDRDLVLVGGQAVNFWAFVYEGRVPALARAGPFASRDVDFCGDRRTVRQCAQRLGGRARVSTLDDATPNSGTVVFVDSAGVQRSLDILSAPFGLAASEVRDTAIAVDILDDAGNTTGVRFHVVHPVLSMESRVHNVAGCQPPVTIDPLAPLILTPLLRPVHSALMLPALTSPALFFCFSL